MRPLAPGIYTAVPRFFRDNEDLDLETFQNHVKYVATTDTIPVIAGTMGEACHLTADERSILVKTTRKVLDMSPRTENVPMITGLAGADFVMVIPPGYYAGALKADNMEAVKQYIVDVSEASPVPLIVYNFPAVSAGIDMDFDFVIDMVKSAPNVCGMKFR